MRFFPKIVFSIITNAALFWVISEKIFPEKFSIGIENASQYDYYFAFIIVAIVFGLLNYIVKPILNILTLPIRIITLGLVAILINAVLLYFWEQIMEILDVSYVTIVIEGGWLTYALVGIILSIGNSISGWFTR